jgi:hypothetical protein
MYSVPLKSIASLSILVGLLAAVPMARADQPSCDDRKQLADVHTQIAEQQQIIALREERIRQMGGKVGEVPQAPSYDDPTLAEDCP